MDVGILRVGALAVRRLFATMTFLLSASLLLYPLFFITQFLKPSSEVLTLPRRVSFVPTLSPYPSSSWLLFFSGFPSSFGKVLDSSGPMSLQNVGCLKTRETRVIAGMYHYGR